MAEKVMTHTTITARFTARKGLKTPMGACNSSMMSVDAKLMTMLFLHVRSNR